MPRKSRKAPTRDADPLDQYSTWDLRIAKTIYYSIIIASAVTILGIWLTIIGWLIETDKWKTIEAWGPGAGALIIVGIVVLHLFLLVLFYVLFRGGILKLCQRLFKDRVLAKKYEDYTTYIFIITLLVVIIPSIFWEFVANLWAYVFTFNPGEWVLFVGLTLFGIVMIIYIGLVLWNHGVFTVLKRVKRIEEEYEVEEEIKREELKEADDETLQKIYEKQTGKKAIYRGKETKGFRSWKRSMLK